MLIPLLLLVAVLFLIALNLRRHNDMSEGKAQSAPASGAADGGAAEDCREYLSRSPSLLPVQLVEAEKKSLSRSDFPALLVEGNRFDAISVRGWEQPHIQLTVCKI